MYKLPFIIVIRFTVIKFMEVKLSLGIINLVCNVLSEFCVLGLKLCVERLLFKFIGHFGALPS